MKNGSTDQNEQLQLHPRMRVPADMLPSAYLAHVIRAICRNSKVDKDGLYRKALAGITGGRNRDGFARVTKLIDRAISAPKSMRKKLRRNSDSPLLTMPWGVIDEDTTKNINEFDRRFLNGKGGGVLVAVLTMDVLDLDTVAIDAFRGGEAVRAAYGERNTQRQKKLGKDLQQILKQFAALDEPAVMEAADSYVEYRFLHRGKFPNYLKRKEQEGTARHPGYYREWFKKFDEALGYPPTPPGRPPKEKAKG